MHLLQNSHATSSEAPSYVGCHCRYPRQYPKKHLHKVGSSLPKSKQIFPGSFRPKSKWNLNRHLLSEIQNIILMDSFRPEIKPECTWAVDQSETSKSPGKKSMNVRVASLGEIIWIRCQFCSNYIQNASSLSDSFSLSPGIEPFHRGLNPFSGD